MFFVALADEAWSDADKLVTFLSGDDEKVRVLRPFTAAPGLPPGVQVLVAQKRHVGDAFCQ
jgi:hypothetical protein